jgi:osmotically-inducible protein OsmY
MSNKALFFMVLLVSVVFLGGLTISGTGFAQSSDNNSTKTNKQGMSSGGVTAEQQGESAQDRELTQKIRQSVMKDKALSMNAHNVKIITIDGVVTLKGPVASEQEKMAVEELAAEIAGKDNVKSEINIAP